MEQPPESVCVWYNARTKTVTLENTGRTNIERLARLQEMVGGYIQIYRICGLLCYVNEEAAIDGKPYPTTLFKDGNQIIGNVVFLTDQLDLVNQIMDGVRVVEVDQKEKADE